MHPQLQLILENLMEPQLKALLEVTYGKLIGKVHPLVIERTARLVELAYNDAGLSFAAFMGLRTFEEQDGLYAQGREFPGRIVTNARGGDSLHNYGLAVDLVEDGDPNKAGIQWSWANNANYLKLGKYANQVGLEWGGFWKSFKDYPHVQLTGGLKLREIKNLYQTGGISRVWAAVTAFTNKRVA